MEKNSYGGKILADCLKDLGVNTVFTVPGESFLAALMVFMTTRMILM